MEINNFNKVSFLTAMISPIIVESHSLDVNFMVTLSYSHLLLDSNRAHILKSQLMPIEALKAFSMIHLASQCFSGVRAESYFICGFLEIELSRIGNQNKLHVNFFIRISLTLRLVEIDVNLEISN